MCFSLFVFWGGQFLTMKFGPGSQQVSALLAVFLSIKADKEEEYLQQAFPEYRCQSTIPRPLG